MSTWISIIIALIVLGIFVVLHELGHYCAGRLFGFGIVEFSVGMGPAIIKKEKNGILYALRAFPLGGMCRFYGEDEDTGDGKAFSSHKLWQRMIVIAAGPVMNILTAIILATIMLMTYGEYMPSINSFSFENSPAQAAGLEPGDMIVGINGHKLSYYNEISELIINADSEGMQVEVLRGGEELSFTVKDFYNQDEGRNLIGIIMEPARLKYGFFGAVAGSFNYIWQMIKDLISFFGMLFKGQVQSGDVAGPVGIVSIIGQAVRTGFETVLRLGVLISANLGLMNLLPLPALDGGRFIFLIIEAVRGKPVPPEKEGIIHLVGFALLIILVLRRTRSDVRRLIGG